MTPLILGVVLFGGAVLEPHEALIDVEGLIVALVYQNLGARFLRELDAFKQALNAAAGGEKAK